MKSLSRFLIVCFVLAFLPLSCKKSQQLSVQEDSRTTTRRGLANSFAPASPFFYPNFSGGNPYLLSQGTSIQPVCFNPNSPLCFNQWMSQAIPLSTSQAGQPGLFNYFVPTFIPQSDSFIKPEGNANWERVSLPRLSRRDRYSETRIFYSNKQNPEQIVQVETNPETGEKTTTSGSVAFIPVEDIELTGSSGRGESSRTGRDRESQRDRESEKITENEKDSGDKVSVQVDREQESSSASPADKDTGLDSQPDSGISSSSVTTSPSAPPALEQGSSLQTGSSPSTQTQALQTGPGDNSIADSATDSGAGEPASSLSTKPDSVPKAQTPPSAKETIIGTAPPARPDYIKAPEATASPQDSPPPAPLQAQIKKDTMVLPATAVKEIKTGCFAINKSLTSTEAHFCEECIRNTEQNQNFMALMNTQNFLSSLRKNLGHVFQASGKKTDLSSENAVTKICSPDQTIKKHIEKFEATCPNYNYSGGFKKFFKEHLCKSCKKGIPIELMMAMMSIESRGNCQATNKNRNEHSAGLLQVNANEHKCRSGYTVRTEENVTCLKNLNNNWNKATSILSDKFCATNGGIESSGYAKAGASCSNWLKDTVRGDSPTCPSANTSWLSMGADKREAFRRAVSAYNGGEGHTLEALFYGRVAKQYPQGYRSEKKWRYGKEKASWEELRAFYFISRFKYGKGRGLNETLGNLAHTEAVLGREVKDSPPGMIEIWSQYKTQFLKDNPGQCSH